MSRFLTRLDMEWKLQTNDFSRAEIRARQAGYFARIGNFDQAMAIVAELRKQFGDGHSGRVTIWIMISEALIHHYNNLDLIALDRVMRAQFLSHLMQDSQLDAIASAWRAHIEFDHSKFNEMFVSLCRAIRAADENNTDALSRVSNVVCKAALLCGESSLAKSQFLLGREYALRDGDQAGVEALQHNKAAFRLSRIRSSRCFGDIDVAEIKETRVEIETAKSLQNLTGISALSSYIELCQARLLLVEGRFKDAIDRLKGIKGSGPFPVGSFNPEIIELEIAYCHSSLGEFDEAEKVLDGREFLNIGELDPDEQMVVRWTQLQLSIQNTRFGSVDTFQHLFQSTVDVYKELMTSLKSNLNNLPWKRTD